MPPISVKKWSQDLDLRRCTVHELEAVRVFANQQLEDAQNLLAAIDAELERRHQPELPKEE
jgi:hypothetical protein